MKPIEEIVVELVQRINELAPGYKLKGLSVNRYESLGQIIVSVELKEGK